MNKKPSWDLSQIPPVIGIEEEIGYPQLFIGRQSLIIGAAAAAEAQFILTGYR